MQDTNQEKEDEVLRRMLATKPAPHKAGKTSAEPRPRRVNSGKKEGEQGKRS